MHDAMGTGVARIDVVACVRITSTYCCDSDAPSEECKRLWFKGSGSTISDGRVDGGEVEVGMRAREAGDDTRKERRRSGIGIDSMLGSARAYLV
jgi:hypothetical protein